jgi:hypothetical protein
MYIVEWWAPFFYMAIILILLGILLWLNERFIKDRETIVELRRRVTLLQNYIEKRDEGEWK